MVVGKPSGSYCKGHPSLAFRCREHEGFGRKFRGAMQELWKLTGDLQRRRPTPASPRPQEEPYYPCLWCYSGYVAHRILLGVAVHGNC